MTVEGKDTFSRANQSGWGTASDGQTWSHTRGSSNWNIASNEGTVDTNSGFYNVFTLGSTTLKDAELLVRYTPGASGDSGGLTIRHIDLNNFYYCDIGNLGQFAEIGKDVATTFTSIKSVAFSWSAGTAYWMRFQVIGTNLALKVWQDGTAEPNAWTVQTTDSSLSSAGAFGIACDPVGSTAMKYDSFYAVDYANCENLSVADSFLDADVFIPVDALSASDMSSALQSWNVDALSAADSTLFTDSFIPVEALTASDTLLSTDSASFVEANSASDTFSSQTGFIPVDSLSTSDSLLAQDGYSATDGLNVLDTFLSQDGAAWTEANSTSDTFNSQSGFIPVDSLSTSDSLLSQDSYSTTDSLTALDVLLSQGGATWVEVNTTSDSYASGVTYLPVEGLSVSESLLISDGYMTSDLLTVSDMQSALQSWGIDALSVSDSFAVNGLFVPIEALSAIEKLLAVDQVAWLDSLSIADSFTGISGPPAAPSGVNVTWLTRDGQVDWYTRDGNTSWNSRG